MKPIYFDPHALRQAQDRGTTRDEIISTVRTGRVVPAKLGRLRYRRTFPYHQLWHGRFYAIKEVNAIVAEEADHFIVVTVITRYY